MALQTIPSGNFIIYEGTATELATVLKGKSKSQVVGFTYNGSSGVYCLILGL